MTTFDDVRAARMYPSSSLPSGTGRTGGTAASLDASSALADRLYPSTATEGEAAERANTPRAVQQLRQSDPARRLFDAGAMLAPQVPDNSLGSNINHAEARQVLVDLGVDSTEAGQLPQLVREAEQATEETRANWRAESEKLIADQYSPADLDAARKFVLRDERVRDWLEATGLGNHPQVVSRFIQLARSARAAGRLK